ncbi:MAG TPA: hypothetical protein VET65_03225 [Candidatus Limnocylindrales bacterium]|nr:hypothetical protein [Candidatus Limnocylindrales bacterium]
MVRKISTRDGWRTVSSDDVQTLVWILTSALAYAACGMVSRAVILFATWFLFLQWGLLAMCSTAALYALIFRRRPRLSMVGLLVPILGLLLASGSQFGLEWWARDRLVLIGWAAPSAAVVAMSVAVFGAFLDAGRHVVVRVPLLLVAWWTLLLSFPGWPPCGSLPCDTWYLAVQPPVVIAYVLLASVLAWRARC